MIEGKVKIDKKTKNLVKRINADEIAVIAHQDIDQIAGKSLANKKVKAVINTCSSISSKYPNKGPSILLAAGIVIIDGCNPGIMDKLQDGDRIRIDENMVYRDKEWIATGIRLTPEIIQDKLNKARDNLNDELDRFIDNTLRYARQEKELILDIDVPDIGIDFKGRHALIVVRGKDYQADLNTVKSYIREMKPIIVAVDGGADACLDMGFVPDVIVGDMDSITDKGLQCGGILVVHAYPDGRAPGLQRIEELGLTARVFPAPGTSEDIAMLLAYEKGAELITAVGTHTHMIDFLEKGRAGMASTMLVRLKVGNKLVDAKGLSKLYENRIYYHYWIQILLAVLLPLGILGIFSPPLKHLFQLLLYKFNLIF